METLLRRVVVTVGFLLLATLPVSRIRGTDPIPTSWNPQAAAKYLDERAECWLN